MPSPSTTSTNDEVEGQGHECMRYHEQAGCVSASRHTIARGRQADAGQRHHLPVVDDNGALTGIVSEGDLIRPERAARETRRQSWLEVFAEGEPLAPEFLDWLHSQSDSARAVMSAPVITVSEDAELGEIARVFVTHRIKRVPVVRDGRVTGIIARGDLLRVLAANKTGL